MTFFQLYANVPAKKSTEAKKLENIAKRVPKRVRAMQRPSKCIVTKPCAERSEHATAE